MKEGGDALTVFGGAGGAFFVEEMRRGSVGIMPHAALPDLFRSVWDLFQSGDEAGAVAEFNRMTPLLRVMTQGAGPSSLHLVKETLRLRGGVHVGERAASRHAAERVHVPRAAGGCGVGGAGCVVTLPVPVSSPRVPTDRLPAIDAAGLRRRRHLRQSQQVLNDATVKLCTDRIDSTKVE